MTIITYYLLLTKKNVLADVAYICKSELPDTIQQILYLTELERSKNECRQ